MGEPWLRSGPQVGIHVDAASGGFIAPFQELWAFRFLPPQNGVGWGSCEIFILPGLVASSASYSNLSSLSHSLLQSELPWLR